MKTGPLAATFVLLLAMAAGCLKAPPVLPDVPDVLAPINGITNVTVANVMTFSQSIVKPAQGVANDLYEPTMEVSATGTIYVAGHVIGAATTGTPAYYSNDDGATWEPLPFLASLQSPPPVQGSQPPPGDEGFIVAGDNGQAWMADIYAAGFTVSGWCGDGAELCYDNRYAYDRTATATGPCAPVTSLNDRPWAAYGGGKLLLVNNPGGGPMQLGVMSVPPATPVGAFDPVTGPKWNLCASSGGSIPGIPAMRSDGFFAVPQIEGRKLNVVIGNAADIFKVEQKIVFNITSGGGGTSNGGRTAFDADGNLYVGARNNTVQRIPGQPGPLPGVGGTPTRSWVTDGRFKLAVSTDDGQTFQNLTFSVGNHTVESLYLDSNPWGPGALLTWSQLGEEDGGADWYVAHVAVGPNGEPVLQNVSLAVDEGPRFSAHVMGAGLGPDGRAYFVNFEDAEMAEYAGSTPISVWKQVDGPRLPVLMGPMPSPVPQDR